MNARPRLAVDETTRIAVTRASNPHGSAWVSANAGSGKTYVLSQRVVRLLLAGTDPARILCITFTKAAAAEMATRVFATLSRWTTLADEDLAQEIAEIEGVAPDRDRLAAARRLFARALDTPGGLKIQTIHAFCERLLHQFPFEANVAGHFEILDDRDAAALKVEARRRILARAADAADGRLGRALATVLGYASDAAYEKALAAFIDSRDRFAAWIAAAGSLDRALLSLRAALGLAPSDTVASLRRLIVTESLFDDDAICRLVELLRKSDRDTDRKAARRLGAFLLAESEEGQIDAWLGFMLTGDGDLRKATSLVTRNVRDGWPGLAGMLAQEVDRLERLLDRIRAGECFATTEAMLHLADAAIAEYERLKTARGALDFEDLVVGTASLLSRSDAAQWVQYKLDRGLDHILVDEAQDTSPRQWQVITALAEDFFAGLGASQATRTLFAVGDEKQSIFSFQGAVPVWFSRVQRDFGRKARAAAFDFFDLQLHLSFRSTETVLSAVDKVFAAEHARAGVTMDEVWPYHTSARRGDPGRVVVWPMIEPPEQPEPEDWAAPLDHLDAKSPEIVLAERIAVTVDGWLKTGETVEATGAPIRPGGILILARTRGPHTEAINRALKSRGIPIAGADRLQLGEHIAVTDLMALGRVMLLPDDDLSLAAALKSPLIGLSEDDLFRLAHGRDGSLWEALGAAEDEVYREARHRLETWLADADWRNPHAFFARILGPERGREGFMRRLGAEVEDVLDEFLAQALAYERANTPSLQGFLAWLETAPTDIKRDTDMLRDEVRVMTVHGAKGLEADIVFLVDTGAAPVHTSHDPCVLALTDDNHAVAPTPLVWMRGKRAMPQSVTAHIERLRLRSAEEYRRLLYVAMTRARDRLYVCGTRKRNTDQKGGWHALVRDALGPEAHRVEAPDGGLLALEWPASAAPPPGHTTPVQNADAEAPLPDWIRHPVAVQRRSERRLHPSSPIDGDESRPLPNSVRGAGQARATGLARGRLIHRLLQSLPDHPPAARREIGERYLAATVPECLDRVFLLDEVMAVLEGPDFAPIFAPGSRGEVEITGRIALPGGSTVISGRIDRIAVTPDRVFVIDYKTSRPAPRSLAEVPPDYVTQLALYRRVLAGLYPGRLVVAALLWTDIPALMEIPPHMLDAAESVMIDGGASHAGGKGQTSLP